MTINYLIKGPITPDFITKLIGKTTERTDTGGHSIFLGQVRADEINGKKVRAIEYSAYEAMVKLEADAIKDTILSEFADARSIDIVHSTGVVNAGEISLFVLVSAGHRKHAIEACSKTVELIKVKLPIWKKEIFEDSSFGWRQNT
ncbi:MAG TPA: molybdenum cofactor biosynthesis protein MoaE [Bacteroidales bacterium]